MSWHDDAACRDEDPELFFPIGSTGPAILQLSQAKAVCAGCAVQSRCLEWAVAAGVEHGVWGGLGEEERRALRRRAARRRGRIFEPFLDDAAGLT
jgi:WhiB family transcriptional regulator, redox-sensing transcriptional regulator